MGPSDTLKGEQEDVVELKDAVKAVQGGEET